jgi:O-antigen/teichoic acid export membrane protein
MNVVRVLRDLFAWLRGALGGELVLGGVGSGSMRFAEIVLGVATAVFLARLLGPAGLCVYALAFAAVALAALPIELGVPAMVTREAARAQAQGDSASVAALLAFASRMILAFSAVIALGAVALWAVLRDTLPPEQVSTLLATLAIPPLVALANVRAAVLRSLRKPLLGTAADALVRPCGFLLLLAAASVIAPGWLSPARAAALNSASAGLALIFAMAALARHAPARTKPVEAPEDAPYSPRVWLMSAFSLGLLRGVRIAQPQILLLTLGAFGSVDSVGLYRIAQRGANLGSFGFNTVAVLIAPYLARLDAEGERERLQRLITVSAWTIAAFALLPCLLFLFAGRLLLSVLFGPEFEAAYPALAILALTLVATAIFGPAQLVLAMMHREGNATVAVGGAMIVSAALCALLAPSQGVLGAALAEAIGLVGLSAVLWSRAGRVLGLRTSVFGR